MFLPVLLPAQSIIDVATGARCSAQFIPATSATDVQIDCAYQSKPVLSGAKVNIASITGNANGFVIGFTTGGDAVTILLRRPSATAQLHIEAAVNGALAVSKDLAVP